MPQPFTSNRKPKGFRSTGSPRRAGPASPKSDADKAEHEILFQTYFKSVGPRTYAAQVKKANNDNHYLVLTEGKRDEKTGEVRKTRLFVYSEDFVAFFKMLQQTAHYIKDHPLPEEVKQRRDRYWAKKNAESAPGSKVTPDARVNPAPAAAPAAPRPSVAAPGREGRAPSTAAPAARS